MTDPFNTVTGCSGLEGSLWKVWAVILSVLFVTGCGEDGNVEESLPLEKASRVSSSVGDLNACTIITQKTIENVLGTAVVHPRLTTPGYKMSVCSWMSKQDLTKSALSVVYYSEAPLVTWEDVSSQAKELGIDVQRVEGLGDLAVWTPSIGDLQVWASGRKVQLGRPVEPSLDLQRKLVQSALSRIDQR